jgi:hypothetical protein
MIPKRKKNPGRRKKCKEIRAIQQKKEKNGIATSSAALADVE